MDVKIRPYQPGDEKKINDLFGRVFNQTRTLEQWRWEFMDCPEGPAIICIAEANGIIVGHLAVIPVKMTFGSIEFLGGKSENAMVDEKHRRKGIYRRVYEKTLELSRERGVDMIWGFPANVEPPKKVGRKDIGNLVFSVTVINPKEVAKRLMNISIKKRMKIILLISTFHFSEIRRMLFSRRVRGYRNLNVRKITKIDAIFDTFWEEYKKTTLGASSIIISRTSNHLRWRLEKNPYFHFDIFGVFDRIGRMRGYIVLRATGKGDGWIEDMVILNHDVNALSKLLNYSTNYFKNKKVGAVMTFISNKPKVYLKTLKRCGFSTINSQHIVVQALSKNLEQADIYNIENWVVTNLYTEGVPH